MNFDISARLTSQSSIIICQDIKHIMKRKKKIYKIMEGLDQTYDKKRLQIFSNQTKQNETEKVDIYHEKKSNIIIAYKLSYYLKYNLFFRLKIQ